MRAIRVIDEVETLKLMAEPTRAAILELLTEPRSVTELARTLEVPRTRLYHHVALLREKGLIEQVDERRAGALTERVYALTAKTFRPSARLLRSGDVAERVDALTALLFDTTAADLKRSLVTAPDSSQPARLALGRSIAFLTDQEAHRFGAELEELVARFDRAHAETPEAGSYALVWAFYPSSRRIS